MRFPRLLQPLTVFGLMAVSAAAVDAQSTSIGTARTWRLLPDRTLYEPYRADPKEPRFSTVWLYETGIGWIWEGSVGGRFPVIGYLREDPAGSEGLQLELEGGGFTRLDVGRGTELDAADFKVGVVITWRSGDTALKGGFSHLSSHAGDEFLERNPGYQRRDFYRDSVILGIRRRGIGPVSVYGELDWAVDRNGGARPLAVRFGTEYEPRAPGDWRGAPFAAVNILLRQAFDFGADLNLLAGWQWTPADSDRHMRAGIQYYRGRALQYQFFDKREELVGTGLWFDF